MSKCKFWNNLYIRAFVINFFIAFLVFIPFMIENGGILTLCDDFNLQQIPLNMLSNKAVKSGNVEWSWNVDIGSSFIGATSFYVTGSPFFYLSLLFPATWYPKLVGWIFMLKYAVAGVTSYAYIQQFCKDKRYAIIGSILYAFSGFQATNMLFYHFHDVVAIFPLLLLGLDMLVEKERKGFFAFTVFLSALVSFYFFIGEVVFLIIYFIARYWLGDWKQYKKILPCIIEGILGIGMAMFLFLPTIAFNLQNPRVSELLPTERWFDIDRRYLLNLFRTFLLPAENMRTQSYIVDQDYSSWAAYLPMVSVLPTFAYVLKNRKTWLTRTLLIFGVICVVPILNSLFYMVSVSNYHRWYYMLILLMCVATVQMLEHGEEYHLSFVAIGFTILTVLMFIMSIWWDQSKFQMIFAKEGFYWIFAIGIIGMLATGILDGIFRRSHWHYMAFLIGVGLFAIITNVETCKEYKHIATYIKEPGNEPSQEYYAKVCTFAELDNPDEAYRFTGIDNSTFMVGNISGTASFLSTVNGSVFELHDFVSGEREVFSPVENDGLKELLSGKFYISTQEDTSAKLNRTVDTGYKTYYIYENDNILPIGFSYDSYVTKSEIETYDFSERLFIMLQTLVIPDEYEGLVSERLEHFDIKAKAILDWNTLQNQWVTFHKETSSSFIRDKNSFTSIIDLEKGKYVFFSVPYDKGWKAKVNGKVTDIININGLMAVAAEEGNNVIEFSYTNIYLRIGIVISIVSFMIWGAVRKRDRKNEKEGLSR